MNDADYKAEADANLSIALTGGYQHLATADLISIAQVNATLHLAEQQRVANLIAYRALHPDHGALAIDRAIDEGIGR